MRLGAGRRWCRTSGWPWWGGWWLRATPWPAPPLDPAKNWPTTRWPTCSKGCRSESGSTKILSWTAGPPSGNCTRLQNHPFFRENVGDKNRIRTDPCWFCCCSSRWGISRAWSVVGVGFSPPARGRRLSTRKPSRLSSSRLNKNV